MDLAVLEHFGEQPSDVVALFADLFREFLGCEWLAECIEDRLPLGRASVLGGRSKDRPMAGLAIKAEGQLGIVKITARHEQAGVGLASVPFEDDHSVSGSGDTQGAAN